MIRSKRQNKDIVNKRSMLDTRDSKDKQSQHFMTQRLNTEIYKVQRFLGYLFIQLYKKDRLSLKSEVLIT